MRDAYGTRYAVIAGFGYPRAGDPNVLLLDIDTSAFITLADVALRKRRMPLPPSTSLYRDVDSTLMTVPFVEWYTGSHATEPGTEAVSALAEQWMEGALHLLDPVVAGADPATFTPLGPGAVI